MDFGNLDDHHKINPEGRGLGLSICKTLIERMGGQIFVDSLVGEGTTFTVRLRLFVNFAFSYGVPFSTPNESKDIFDSNQSIVFQSLDLQVEDSKRPKALIVNDTLFLLMGFSSLLQEYFDVTTADDGHPAIQIYRSKPPDYFTVVILDINMLGINGIETARQMQQYSKSPMFHFVSGDPFSLHEEALSDLQYGYYF